ncbi:hypothetical protein EI998_07235 [Streptococcus suis]|uniref:Uncharacterized protein n=1 Tax=Streptococcus suis TaxID=1307 RepID=A0A426TD79_STRSU|nr:hypothetical protein EI998_07235 [Streptococcus suis]
MTSTNEETFFPYFQPQTRSLFKLILPYSSTDYDSLPSTKSKLKDYKKSLWALQNVDKLAFV